ncbi:apolipoprotein N-acyltransferase [Mycolicibacterium poriferae]|uniref:Apolipoprotein N-acyltransferase n=1 Tax=Mycolicibacterium poriferae TaxID=39694 RepID=A0A6N4VEQ6_9MYCO|nr:apolipoprotein N-acyltransferase [Mycolicibacterium poriferae]MCV7264523.1 apolipoprotein N-acyltransferase [Mycolicibacterium poriferae]BBX52570.1 apolipoprotein N-acyltransferase [Mycolicibacterium poriferae]
MAEPVAAEAAEADDEGRRSRLARFGTAVVDRMPALTVTMAAGIALYAAFPPLGWWYTAIAAFALLSWVLKRPGTTVVGGFGYGLLFGLTFYLPLLPWISGLVGAVPWLALSFAEALFPAAFGAVAVVVRRLPGWPVWFAGLWSAQEWLKSTVPFGGFPWGVVGYSQTESPLLSLAYVGGAPLVSFAVALLGFGVAALTLEIIDWWRRDAVSRAAAAPAVLIPGICIALVFLSAALAWPTVRKAGAGAGDNAPVTVAAVQGNVPRLGLDFNAQRRAVLDNHVAETLRLAERVRAGQVPQPMFVIWPENSSDIDPLANADAAQLISRAADAIDAPILVGGVVAADGYSPTNPVSNNTVIVWNPETGPADRHDKQIVQPFGEYLPWRSFFSKLSPYADRAGYFVPGQGDGVVQAAGVPVGVTTCWEVIFDRAPREAVRSGAQVLAVPTNNATFNQAMSEQQLAFGRLRAVEHDRYVVVAGTTGISAVIAPDGRELARTEFFEPATLVQQIRLNTALTPATRYGPYVEAVLVALGVSGVLGAILHNGSSSPTRLRRRRVTTDNDKGAS